MITKYPTESKEEYLNYIVRGFCPESFDFSALRTVMKQPIVLGIQNQGSYWLYDSHEVEEEEQECLVS